jgi:hypothetical protein
MVQKYEYYDSGDDSSGTLYGPRWYAQTFKTGAVGHTITSVKLLMWREGSPGTVTVSIKAVNGSGHPTGADLTSGTTNGNTLTTNTAGEWREITLTEYTLAVNTTHAIVVRATSGDADNAAFWRLDSTSPTYADGNMEYSGNSGASWTSYTGYDQLFEVWGNPLISYYKIYVRYVHLVK